MSNLLPRQPHRPLLWPDIVYDLADALAGSENPVYIVGGAVRDALLHHPLKDLDLATRAHAAELARHIANRLGGDYYVLDAQRDVGRALVDTPEGRITIDVARFRGDDLLADLVDRDFTLNAMAVDLGGDLGLLIDPLNGERDIQEKTLRRCSPSVIGDDPIRVLRAARQSVQFGFRIDSETLRDLRQTAPRLVAISPERTRDELIKLLALPRPASALRVADAVGALQMVVPEVNLLHGLEQGHIKDTWQHTLLVIENLAKAFTAISAARTDNTAATFGLGMMVIQLDRYRAQLQQHLDTLWPNERPHRALMILAALLHDCGKAVTPSKEDRPVPFAGHEQAAARLAEERAAALRLSNAEKERLSAVLQHYVWMERGEVLTPLALHRYWWKARAAGVDACLLALSDYLGTWGNEIDQDDWLAQVERARILLEAYFERYNELIEPPPLLDGMQLMNALGLKPSAVIGRLLEQIREAQVTGDVKTREDALALARAGLRNSSHSV